MKYITFSKIVSLLFFINASLLADNTNNNYPLQQEKAAGIVLENQFNQPLYVRIRNVGTTIENVYPKNPLKNNSEIFKLNKNEAITIPFNEIKFPFEISVWATEGKEKYLPSADLDNSGKPIATSSKNKEHRMLHVIIQNEKELRQNYGWVPNKRNYIINLKPHPINKKLIAV